VYHAFYDAIVELCMKFKENVHLRIYRDIALAKCISPYIRRYTVSLNFIRSSTVIRRTHDVLSISQYEIFRCSICSYILSTCLYIHLQPIFGPD
jgi:hypothetical protein